MARRSAETTPRAGNYQRRGRSTGRAGGGAEQPFPGGAGGTRGMGKQTRNSQRPGRLASGQAFGTQGYSIEGGRHVAGGSRGMRVPSLPKSSGRVFEGLGGGSAGPAMKQPSRSFRIGSSVKPYS